MKISIAPTIYATAAELDLVRMILILMLSEDIESGGSSVERNGLFQARSQRDGILISNLLKFQRNGVDCSGKGWPGARYRVSRKELAMSLQTDFGFDGTQSLESLEGPMTDYNIPTALMGRVEKLSRVPLSSIDGEGLRLLLVQRMFLKSVIPAALVVLEREPFAGGNLEQGALMRSLFQFTPGKFWNENKSFFSFAQSILKGAESRLQGEIDVERDMENRAMLLEAKENFEKAHQFVLEMENQIDSVSPDADLPISGG